MRANPREHCGTTRIHRWAGWPACCCPSPPNLRALWTNISVCTLRPEGGDRASAAGPPSKATAVAAGAPLAPHAHARSRGAPSAAHSFTSRSGESFHRTCMVSKQLSTSFAGARLLCGTKQRRPARCDARVPRTDFLSVRRRFATAPSVGPWGPEYSDSPAGGKLVEPAVDWPSHSWTPPLGRTNARPEEFGEFCTAPGVPAGARRTPLDWLQNGPKCPLTPPVVRAVSVGQGPTASARARIHTAYAVLGEASRRCGGRTTSSTVRRHRRACPPRRSASPSRNAPSARDSSRSGNKCGSLRVAKRAQSQPVQWKASITRAGEDTFPSATALITVPRVAAAAVEPCGPGSPAPESDRPP
jgi:hypothetical protein